MKQVKLPSGEYLIQEVPDATGDFIVRATKHCDNGSISWFNKWTNKETITLIPPGSWQLLGADPVNLTEEEAGEIVEGEVCEFCGGDGKETCNNPDHGFIGSMPGDTGRLGCPVCGHDPKHKVKNGGLCFECDGTGKQPTTESLDSLAASLGISKPFVVLKNINHGV